MITLAFFSNVTRRGIGSCDSLVVPDQGEDVHWENKRYVVITKHWQFSTHVQPICRIFLEPCE